MEGGISGFIRHPYFPVHLPPCFFRPYNAVSFFNHTWWKGCGHAMSGMWCGSDCRSSLLPQVWPPAQCTRQRRSDESAAGRNLAQQRPGSNGRPRRRTPWASLSRSFGKAAIRRKP